MRWNLKNTPSVSLATGSDWFQPRGERRCPPCSRLPLVGPARIFSFHGKKTCLSSETTEALQHTCACWPLCMVELSQNASQPNSPRSSKSPRNPPGLEKYNGKGCGVRKMQIYLIGDFPPEKPVGTCIYN